MIVALVLVGAIIFVGSAVVVGGIQGVQQGIATPTAASTTQASQPTSAANPTQLATKAPTTVPTAAQNGVASHALLGGTLADFNARYGHYMSNSDVSQHSYDWTLYGAGKKDLTVTFLYNTHADGILYAAPEPQMWTFNQAKSACFALLPSDAQYQRRMTVTKLKDEQLVYLVSSIAKLFPSSAWTDENGNQAKAGTVGLILSHWTDTTYVQCTLQIGLESL